MATTARGLNSTPGVYTREFDLTYSAKSLGVTTLGLVGETLIGPAFQPIPITNWNEFKTYFGGTSIEKYANGYPKYELPYVAKSYLGESNQLYVTKVLGLSGYKYDGLWTLYNTASGNTVEALTALATIRSKAIYTTGETLQALVTNITITDGPVTGLTTDFNLVATKYGGGTETYNVSLDSTKKNYILNVIGNSPLDSTDSLIFVEEMFETTINELVESTTTYKFYNSSEIKLSVKETKHNNYSSTYSYAKTPWFVSEVKGNKIIPLFRFITITDGENANKMFKISIANIDLTTSKFDVYVRSINDTDSNPVIYESFTNCSLDPNSGASYLGQKIGTIDEVNSTKSKYIIADINEDPLVSKSVPMGFGGYEVKYISVSGATASSSDFFKPTKIVYNVTYNDDIKQKKQYYGLSDLKGVDTDFFKFNGIDASGLTITDGFHMQGSASGVTSVSGIGYDTIKWQTLEPSTETETFNDKRLMKFTTYFYGGFDGWDVFRDNRTNTDGYQYNRFVKLYPNQVDVDNTKQFKSFAGTDLETSLGIPNVNENVGITSDFYAFLSGVRSFSNPEAVDINLFATPGIDLINNSLLVNEAIEMLEEERKDAFYVVTSPDKPYGTTDDTKASMFSADDIIGELENTGIDTNFAATYYPWVKFYDKELGQYVFVSPTKDAIKTMAYTDNVAFSWLAPAGLGRSRVECDKAKKNLTLPEEKILIDGRVNILKTFSDKDKGVKIWSQKTLQVNDSQLNRIGVRRMMLYLRKMVRNSSLPLIFEPNDNTTKNKFKEIVNPILTNVKTNRGISDFQIDIDDSVEAKARHEMNVQIWIKPIGALEFINIDFMITDEGFDFNSI
jgi:hypothetical protein